MSQTVQFKLASRCTGGMNDRLQSEWVALSWGSPDNGGMQALVLDDGTLALQVDCPQPELNAEEALIRVVMAGICSTDLELVAGYYPYKGVLGHEFVGIVERCDDAPEWVGKRVVGTINIADDDGACGQRCPEHCPNRTVLGIVGKDGVFADYVTLPIRNLLEVPEDVADEQAVFTEPLAAAVRITEQVNVANKHVVVIGPGRVGLLIAQVLRHFGADVDVIGRSEPSLQLPKDLGFNTFYSDSPSLPTYDMAIEATGNTAGFRVAVDVVRPLGTIVMKSTYAELSKTEESEEKERPFENFAAVMAKIVVDEIKLVGSRCGPFSAALELLRQGVIRVEPLIDATYPLGEAIEAFEHAAQSGVRKVVLVPDGGMNGKL